jgi:hypothetical protein
MLAPERSHKMVRKKRENGAEKKRKVSKLKLNKETLKDLSDSEQEQIRGGRIINNPSTKCSGDRYTLCATLCGSCGITCGCVKK